MIALLLNLYHAIAPFHQTAFIPGDMTYLGKGKTRSLCVNPNIPKALIPCQNSIDFLIFRAV
ncbi:hypothetical protein IQ257_09160 [Coleofasciculus sp. LEGE 07092]|uniref:hypothetical protein n=1 Tax=Coleofasciculus sp. LEGE 07081 TaxID=2777967 RepID=UPI00188270C0|nr:hypothetical protein [Coleofasciculus sp. LEGE 07081]MBE9126926.1 hypothetical protein [Coleofasciculus sp. LEGE 07081]MBE9148663.1 hypothetical protein [Coleofasciculus sp. LEGE 07092]